MQSGLDTELHGDDHDSAVSFNGFSLVFVAFSRTTDISWRRHLFYHAYGHEDVSSSCWRVELSNAVIVVELKVDGVAFDWGITKELCCRSHSWI